MSERTASDPEIHYWEGGNIAIDTGIACAAFLDKKGVKKLVNFINTHREEFEVQECIPK